MKQTTPIKNEARINEFAMAQKREELTLTDVAINVRLQDYAN